MATEILTEFTLTGIGFDPDEVTTLLGIKPTETWRLGDLIQNTFLHHKHDGWCLSTGQEELDEQNSIDVPRQVRFIFEQLQPYTSKLKDVCARFRLDVELTCVVYIEGDRPAIHFDSDVVRWLAELNAEIDVDLYVLPDPEDNASK